jgi:AraC-like DNA-binding protein
MRHLLFSMIAPHRAFHARRVPGGEATTAHDHDFWEAFLVLGGTGRHVCNGCSHALARGDCWLVRPADVHSLDGETLSILNVAWPTEGWNAWLAIAGLSAEDGATQREAPELETAFARMSEVFAVGSAREELHRARFWGELAAHFWPSSEDAGVYPPWMRRALERFEREEGVRGGYEFLLRSAPVSPRQLHREWARVLGQTPSAWVMQKRLERASLLLLQTALPVQEIAARCGFENVPYFFRVWKVRFDRSPRAYREAARHKHA